MAFGANREFETLEQCMKAVEGQVPDPKAFCEELQRQAEQQQQPSTMPPGRNAGINEHDVMRQQPKPARRARPGDGQPRTTPF